MPRRTRNAILASCLDPTKSSLHFPLLSMCECYRTCLCPTDGNLARWPGLPQAKRGTTYILTDSLAHQSLTPECRRQGIAAPACLAPVDRRPHQRVSLLNSSRRKDVGSGVTSRLVSRLPISFFERHVASRLSVMGKVYPEAGSAHEYVMIT
jgi:hypothetical protein